MNKNSFIGTWKLRSFTLETSSGKITYPFGEKAVGYIMYNDDGYMSVGIMSENRPKFASDDWLSATQEEKAQAFDGLLSYCGKYEIKENENTVIHHPEVMYHPNHISDPQERTFEFSGNKLTLGAAGSIANGERQDSRLVWEKI